MHYHVVMPWLCHWLNNFIVVARHFEFAAAIFFRSQIQADCREFADLFRLRVRLDSQNVTGFLRLRIWLPSLNVAGIILRSLQ